ncbi:MAG: hypothetical protein QXI58_00535 [Candidatus Micrarchaeia archaeon]
MLTKEEIKRKLINSFITEDEVSNLINLLAERIAAFKQNRNLTAIDFFGRRLTISEPMGSVNLSNQADIERLNKEMWKTVAGTIIEFLAKDERWDRLAQAIYEILTQIARVRVNSGIAVQVTCPAGVGTGETISQGDGYIE